MVRKMSLIIGCVAGHSRLFAAEATYYVVHISSQCQARLDLADLALLRPLPRRGSPRRPRYPMASMKVQHGVPMAGRTRPGLGAGCTSVTIPLVSTRRDEGPLGLGLHRARISRWQGTRSCREPLLVNGSAGDGARSRRGRTGCDWSSR